MDSMINIFVKRLGTKCIKNVMFCKIILWNLVFAYRNEQNIKGIGYETGFHSVSGMNKL